MAQTLFQTKINPTAKRISWISWLTAAFALSAQRKSLAQLTKAQLNDIGITESEAKAEAARPIWDAPSHWYR